MPKHQTGAIVEIPLRNEYHAYALVIEEGVYLPYTIVADTRPAVEAITRSQSMNIFFHCWEEGIEKEWPVVGKVRKQQVRKLPRARSLTDPFRMRYLVHDEGRIVEPVESDRKIPFVRRISMDRLQSLLEYLLMQGEFTCPTQIEAPPPSRSCFDELGQEASILYRDIVDRAANHFYSLRDERAHYRKISQDVIRFFREDLEDDDIDTDYSFWLGLALIEMKHGFLSKKTKAESLKVLSVDTLLDYFYELAQTRSSGPVSKVAIKNHLGSIKKKIQRFR